MDLSELLKHRITVIPVTGQNAQGELQTGTAVNSLKCFISGGKRRYLTKDGRELSSDGTVTFSPGIDLAVGYMLQEGKDENNETLLSTGRVVSMETYSFPGEGKSHTEVLVEVN